MSSAGPSSVNVAKTSRPQPAEKAPRKTFQNAPPDVMRELGTARTKHDELVTKINGTETALYDAKDNIAKMQAEIQALRDKGVGDQGAKQQLSQAQDLMRQIGSIIQQSNLV